MTDRKRGFKSFFNGSQPPAKKGITVDLEVNEVTTNDVSE